MRLILFVWLLSFSNAILFAQPSANHPVVVNISGGRVSFGSGDFIGYSVSFEGLKSFGSSQRINFSKLSGGGEFIFENGTKEPVIINPSLPEFLGTTFYHTTNSTAWLKLAYHPFDGFLNLFYMQLGPTITYASRSREIRAIRSVNVLGEATRTSVLAFDNGIAYGYRISTGLQRFITDKFSAGIRLDWSNNNEGEINTLAGIRLGIRL